MKKVFLAAIFISVSVFLTSCGSTGNVATTQEPSKAPQTAEEAVTQKQEEVANEIADEINAVSPANEISSPTTDESEPQTEGEIEAEPEVTTEGETNAQEPEEQELSEKAENPAEPESVNSSEPTGIYYVSTSPAKTEKPAIENNQEENENSQDSVQDAPESESSATNIESDNTESAEEKEAAESDSETSTDDSTEKVSEEDSTFDKEREKAPTTDEKNKVSEYQIFEEPEIVVHDLPEPAKEEPKTEQSADEEIAQIKEEAPVTDETATALQEPEPQGVADEPSSTPKSTENEITAVPPVSPDVEQTEQVEEIPAVLDESEQVKPSRSVNVKINQYLDVTYPGTGWTYIGETDKNDVFNYFGRKLGTKNTTFSLRAKKAGKTILHFYKTDALTGEYIDDYLAVNVENKKSTGRVKAPSYADIVPAKPQRRIDRANENSAINDVPTQEENAQKKQIETPNESALTAPQSKTTAVAPKNQNANPENSKEELKKTEHKQEQAPVNKPKTTEPESNQKQQKESSGPKQNQPKENASAKTEKPFTGTTKSSSSVPAVTQESDIKTVIENKETTTHIKNTESKSEPKTPQSQSFNYTPVSSQSEQTEESPVSSEPVVLVEDTTVTPDESLLEKAKKDFEDKKFADALKEAQEYYNSASTRLDEALFLLGQISESNSQIRDIRFAVDSYDMLVKRYPASKYWKQAKNRSIYLKRFYIDIR